MAVYVVADQAFSQLVVVRQHRVVVTLGLGVLYRRLVEYRLYELHEPLVQDMLVVVMLLQLLLLLLLEH